MGLKSTKALYVAMELLQNFKTYFLLSFAVLFQPILDCGFLNIFH